MVICSYAHITEWLYAHMLILLNGYTVVKGALTKK